MSGYTYSPSVAAHHAGERGSGRGRPHSSGNQAGGPLDLTAHPRATTVLIFGVVGFPFFPLVAPVAWYLGRKARQEAYERGYHTGSGLTAGWVLGMMGSVVLASLVPLLTSPICGGQSEDARVTVARAQVEQLYDAVLAYREYCEMHDIQPSLPSTLSDLLEGPADGEGSWEGAIVAVPQDPWGNEFDYRVEPGTGHVRIVSYGRDGRPGGDGFDADIIYPDESDRR